jgi:mono/diheme cytochrome c family protein
MRKLALIIGLVLLATAAAAMADDDGAAIFKGKCVMCHGADGSGDTPMGKKVAAADLRSDPIQSKPDDAFAATITKGKNKMPAFEEKLSPEQIKAVIAHIRSLKK